MSLEKNGVVVIKGVFTKEECQQMKEHAYLALGKNNDKYPHNPVNYTPLGHPSVLLFPALVDEYLDSIRKDERLVKIVKKYLGSDVKQLNNQVYFREVGDDDQFTWHQDIIFRIPRERHPNIEHNYLQTVIAVDDITIENGAIEFIEGSNKGPEIQEAEMIRKFERGELQGKKYEAQAGDVIIWDLLTIHGSEQNFSKQPRMTYMNGFAIAECALDWPCYLKNGGVQELDYTKIP